MFFHVLKIITEGKIGQNSQKLSHMAKSVMADFLRIVLKP